jgi:hypothetical protein
LKSALAATITILLAGLATTARANPILSFTGGAESTVDGFNATLGWSFTTNQTITVIALDVFDPTGDGSVWLYNSSGQVLASATLSTSDAQEGNGVQFYTQAITPVQLAANSTYFIVEDSYDALTESYHMVTGLAVDSAITYNGAVSTYGFGGTPMGDYIFNGIFDPAWFGPNFDIEVPEPASTAMFAAGLMALGLLRSRTGRDGVPKLP